MRFLKPVTLGYRGERWTVTATLRISAWYVGFAFYRDGRCRSLYLSPLPCISFMLKWVTYD